MNNKYVIVQFPEIQFLMERDGFNENCCLINDEYFFSLYGNSAYFVNENWLHMKICNEPETGCDYNCRDCEVPTTEPEWCEDCAQEAEDSGIEYEFNVTHKTGSWTCENCGGGC